MSVAQVKAETWALFTISNTDLFIYLERQLSQLKSRDLSLISKNYKEQEEKTDRDEKQVEATRDDLENVEANA